MNLADRLRLALVEGARRTPDLLHGDTSDPRVDPHQPVAPAAVLVAVVDRPEPSVILTLRTESMRKHSGQVAFPGGRIDPQDAGPVAAALREAEEEIGLPPAWVDVIGTTDPYRTVTGYQIVPVIGVVPPDLPLQPHEVEVAAIFEVPLAHLLAPGNHLIKSVEWNGAMRTFYEIDWHEHRIWGATAAMIVNLSRRLVSMP